MLKLQFKDKSRPPFWVVEKIFSMGSASKNSLSIDDASVSKKHARIHNQGDVFLLKDLGSDNGTFVNGQRVTQKHITCGDIIKIGDVELEIVDPLMEKDADKWSLIADSSWLSGQEFPITGNIDQVVTIGRSSQCEIVFPGTHLSRLHAEVTINYSSLTIRDMGSANGTFVNDKKIRTAQLYPGDRVRLDVYSFRVFGPGIKLPKSATASMPVIVDLVDPEKRSNKKQWKSKPTSPGNRQEVNLYKKHYKPLVVAGITIVGLVAIATYVALGILGLLS